jgi:hypothetical protein
MQYIATAQIAIRKNPEISRTPDDIVALIKEFYKSDKRAQTTVRDYGEIDVLRKAAFLWVGQSVYKWGWKTLRHAFKYKICELGSNFRICLDLNLGYIWTHHFKKKWARKGYWTMRSRDFPRF